ncbi:MAG: hypothetical protein V3T41_05640 [bacterium]
MSKKAPSVSVKTLARRVERTGRFEIFRKVKAASVHPVLLAELDRVLYDFARLEADEVTRRWHADRRREGIPTSELANVTLAYYERTLRKLRPHFELDFTSGGDERSCRYRGVAPFLAWLDRQRRIRPKSFQISYLSPSTNVLVQLKASLAAERSYIWAAGNEHAQLERLFRALYDALSSSAGKWTRLRSWQANLTYASVCALTCASGVALKLHDSSWPAVIGAAALVDVVVASGLIFLFRQAWPQVQYRFGGVGADGRRPRALLRGAYLSAAAALLAAGSWAIFTSFVRIVW